MLSTNVSITGGFTNHDRGKSFCSCIGQSCRSHLGSHSVHNALGGSALQATLVIHPIRRSASTKCNWELQHHCMSLRLSQPPHCHTQSSLASHLCISSQQCHLSNMSWPSSASYTQVGIGSPPGSLPVELVQRNLSAGRRHSCIGLSRSSLRTAEPYEQR